ncbi:MAG TPA: bifunctional serine/threonine-protein kinase/formylglycine-generating enzyme family protein [Labilithrix sp.]
MIELQPGTVFAGAYRIERKLGSGGMGDVYVAEQLATGRKRALKLMHSGMTLSDQFRERFTLEARVGARIESEHVVEVIDAGVDEPTGSPWLAMELLAGEDVATAVERTGPFTRERMLAVLGDVCHALGAAHASGIVHRDLKPENVFLVESKRARRAETAKVLDFGIAKVIADARSTNTGTMGSPFWMAPEQTERHALITPATDVWALGLLAFFVLTGKVYFRTADDELRSFHAFLRELILDELPTASVRAKECSATLPDGFEAWFAKCVVRDPKERWPDARAALAALREALGEPPLSTWAPDTKPSSGKGARVATAPMPGANVRISSGGEAPASATQAEALGSARTVADAEAPRDATVPVQGPSPRLLAIGGAAIAIAIGGAAIALLRSGSEAPARTDAGAAPPPLAACPLGMVHVAGGELAMGSEAGMPEEKPVHGVKVAPFCADATEVTAGEYATCVQKKSCAKPESSADWPGITKDDRQRWSKYCNFGSPRVDHPMNCVAFDDAAAYCRAFGKRLPTEEQWEILARGSEGRSYPWGLDAPTPAHANACDRGCAQRGDANVIGPRLDGDDGFEATSPAATFQKGATQEGVFDLAGNVAEWTDAPFCPYGEPACGTSARVVRGGSWLSDSPIQLRGAARAKAAPQARAPDIGFRCVK